MATTTTNLGLIEPAGQDRALVANINTNSEKIDAEAGKVRDNFALVQNGDTATQAISKDQLVVWKGVLKKATANIASGATLSSSNLSDDTIAAEIAALNSNLAINQSALENVETGTKTNKVYYNSFMAELIFQSAAQTWTDGDLIGTLPTGIRPKENLNTFASIYGTAKGAQIGITTNGNVTYDTSESLAGRLNINAMFFI